MNLLTTSKRFIAFGHTRAEWTETGLAAAMCVLIGFVAVSSLAATLVSL